MENSDSVLVRNDDDVAVCDVIVSLVDNLLDDSVEIWNICVSGWILPCK